MVAVIVSPSAAPLAGIPSFIAPSPRVFLRTWILDGQVLLDAIFRSWWQAVAASLAGPIIGFACVMPALTRFYNRFLPTLITTVIGFLAAICLLFGFLLFGGTDFLIISMALAVASGVGLTSMRQ
jgi:uncharacterized membrane protein AbrB (regulator of aidB expression)